MQSELDATRAAESCVLADAERHASELYDDGSHPDGGTCRACSHCVRNAFAAAKTKTLEDELVAHYGICAREADEPELVALDEWHEWDECWTEAVS